MGELDNNDEIRTVLRKGYSKDDGKESDTFPIVQMSAKQNHGERCSEYRCDGSHHLMKLQFTQDQKTAVH